jgi:anaerobic magnesium-protoporphyrin IX monomethyl ester cyclase
VKVLLVNPTYTTSAQFSPPLGLGYVGASLVKKGHEVKLLDLTLKDSPSFLQAAMKFKPDFVGISGLTTQYPAMKDLARSAKSLGIKVVVGGIHVSAIPAFVLRDSKAIDYAIKGEGEIAFASLLEKGSPVGIPGMYYRVKDVIEGTQPQYLEDLDSLSFPWSFLDLKTYKYTKVNGITSKYGTSAISVISSRGCPYNCAFCSASQAHGKRIRKRSPENFLAELEDLKRQGTREVQILDDNFTFYRENAYEISKGMVDRKLNFAWTLPNGIRADRVDEELLTMMKKSGCYYFGIGIESGSEKVLRMMDKSLSLDRVRETAKLADKLGFVTQGFLLANFPGETSEDLKKTKKFVLSLPIDRISINPVVPYPGSRMYHEVENWSGLNRTEYKSVLPKEERAFIRELYIRFYFNPKRFVKHIRKMKTFSQLLGFVRAPMKLLQELG